MYSFNILASDVFELLELVPLLAQLWRRRLPYLVDLLALLIGERSSLRVSGCSHHFQRGGPSSVAFAGFWAPAASAFFGASPRC